MPQLISEVILTWHSESEYIMPRLRISFSKDIKALYSIGYTEEITYWQTLSIMESKFCGKY